MKENLFNCSMCEHCSLKENENNIRLEFYFCAKNEHDIKDIKQDYCSDIKPIYTTK